MKTRWKIVLAVVAVAAIVALFVFLPFGSWALGLVKWVRDQGAVGVVLFGVAYVLATVLMLPGSIFTLAAGFLYGVIWGTLLVSPLSVMGATLAFIVGRYFAREWVAKKIEGHPRFGAIDDALADGGLKVVILLRLSPVLPFNLLNYGLSVTRVSLGSYVLGSFLGMLPATALYVYLGSLLTSAGQLLGDGQEAPGQGAKNVFYWVGLAATLVATILITRSAKKALAKRLDSGKAGD